jgi:hypothetical protein
VLVRGNVGRRDFCGKKAFLRLTFTIVYQQRAKMLPQTVKLRFDGFRTSRTGTKVQRSE